MKEKKDKKNIKLLKKFMKKHKDELREWLQKYTDLFNECGQETHEGMVQIGFAGAIMTGMLETMKNMPKEEKLCLIDKIKDHIEKE